MAKPIIYLCGNMHMPAPAEVTESSGNGAVVTTGLHNLALLKKPMIFNFREDFLEYQAYYRDRFYPNELDYFKQNGNNATLFIHGYHVPFGNYSDELIATVVADEFDYKEIHPLPTAAQAPYQDNVNFHFDEYSLPLYDLKYLHETRTEQKEFFYQGNKIDLYRSAKQIQQRFKGVNSMPSFADDKLNGSGAHSWWLHMEYNLNQAAGFKGFEYYYEPAAPHYTRLVQIAWQGDPANALDYTKIEPNAIKAAPAVAKLIKQLHDEGIKVNVIAHSAGNIVLTHAMHYLCAKERHYDYVTSGDYQHSGTPNPDYGKYNDAIENAFFWQAAMPNTALSPNANSLDPTIFNRYHTASAHQAAKHMQVFYSHYDNILGPIPMDNQGHSLENLKQKYHSSGGPEMTDAMLGVDFIRRLENNLHIINPLTSVYQGAQLFGVPIDGLLMSKQVQHQVYQAWLEKNKAAAVKQGWRESLVSQQALIAKQYPNALRNLSFFIALYLAIMDGSIVAFCLEPKNVAFLEEFKQRLSPEEAHHLEHLLEQFNQDDQLSTIFVNQKINHLLARAKKHTWLAQELHNLLAELKAKLFAAGEEATISLANHLLSLLNNPEPTTPSHWADAFDFIWKSAAEELSSQMIRETTRKLIDRPDDFDHPRFDDSQALTMGANVATILITISMTPGIKQAAAMGYSGPDLTDCATRKLIAQGKLSCFNQKGYLKNHCAMKIPDEELKQHVYQEQIFSSNNSYQLGQWPKP